MVGLGWGGSMRAVFIKDGVPWVGCSSRDEGPLYLFISAWCYGLMNSSTLFLRTRMIC